jgi:hypothetical protein
VCGKRTKAVKKDQKQDSVGKTFEFIDRRKSADFLYTDPERRSGMERRGIFWDRRKPKVPCCYSAKN